MSTPPSPPGWYPNPNKPETAQWWNGEKWEDVQPELWEYTMTDHLMTTPWGGKKYREEIQQMGDGLNAMGKFGWEMVSTGVHSLPTGATGHSVQRTFWKRRLLGRSTD
jgi:hypothetical protein